MLGIIVCFGLIATTVIYLLELLLVVAATIFCAVTDHKNSKII